MNLTRKHKVYAGVLAAGLAALGADRLVFNSDLTGPEHATASLLIQPQVPGGSGSAGASRGALAAAAALSEPTRSAKASLADRLEGVGRLSDPGGDPGSGRIADAFQPSEAWLSAMSPRKAQEAAQEEKGQAAAQGFIAHHHLTAIMKTQQGGYALVDGQYVAAGQEVDGFKAVSVTQASVVFEGQGVRFSLALDPGAQRSASR
jgi:hypothetical protein